VGWYHVLPMGNIYIFYELEKNFCVAINHRFCGTLLNIYQGEKESLHKKVHDVVDLGGGQPNGP